MQLLSTRSYWTRCKRRPDPAKKGMTDLGFQGDERLTLDQAFGTRIPVPQPPFLTNTLRQSKTLLPVSPLPGLVAAFFLTMLAQTGLPRKLFRLARAGFRPANQRFRPYSSWLLTQSSELIAAASESSPARTVPATISANL